MYDDNFYRENDENGQWEIVAFWAVVSIFALLDIIGLITVIRWVYGHV